jgi:hypothetical protein
MKPETALSSLFALSLLAGCGSHYALHLVEVSAGRQADDRVLVAARTRCRLVGVESCPDDGDELCVRFDFGVSPGADAGVPPAADTVRQCQRARLRDDDELTFAAVSRAPVGKDASIRVTIETSEGGSEGELGQQVVSP